MGESRFSFSQRWLVHVASRATAFFIATERISASVGQKDRFSIYGGHIIRDPRANRERKLFQLLNTPNGTIELCVLFLPEGYNG